MTAAVGDLRLIFAGEDQNVDALLGEGWRPADGELRWTQGGGGVLKLPAMRPRPWFVLRLDARLSGGAAQPLTVRLNGVEVARYAHQEFVPYDIVVAGDLVRDEGGNDLAIDHPHALGLRQLSLETLDPPPHETPQPLPPIAAPPHRAQAKAVSEAFQSLGQNCDLGLFQRHYGAEPFGLLRFASIFPDKLILGLKTRFAGVGDLEELSLFLPEGSREWHGRHRVYGLAYHTFITVEDTDAATLAAKEGPRLKYLARLLCEQLETNGKIFVRVDNFETPGEALALHRLLQTYHPRATLLFLQAAPEPERIGRVEEVRPGLYRGYLSRRSDIAGTRDPKMCEEWLRLCATVLGHECASVAPDEDEAVDPKASREDQGMQRRSDPIFRNLGQTPAPLPAVKDLRLIFGGVGQDVAPYLGEGWHGAEVGHRWTDGFRSVLHLPPLQARPWLAMTLQGWALKIGDADRAQSLTVSLNGATLGRWRLDGGMPMTIAIPGDLVRSNDENIVVFDHPEAAKPSELQPGHGDTRLLSLAFQRVDVEPLDEPLSLAPRLLARPAPVEDAAEVKALAEAFQSLGQNCDVGEFQRLSGAEPFGLLRFAGIFPAQLLQGLRTRFAGIGDADKLSFFAAPDGQGLHGKHAVYGLDYHTFLLADSTDVEALRAKEAPRLDYLARLFFEQLENDEKIFLRVHDFETPEEALALHLILRSYHPRARLLVLQAAPAHAPERIGRVIELRPGLYRGYLSRPSNLALTHNLQLLEEWRRLCATVVSHERARG